MKLRKSPRTQHKTKKKKIGGRDRGENKITKELVQ